MKDIEWKFQSHYSGEKEHGLLYRSKYKCVAINMETHTKYKNDIPGKSETIFWTAEDKNNYKTLDELLLAIDKKQAKGGVL